MRRSLARPTLRLVLRALLWALPFLLHAADAAAWGLYTHAYFAQAALWSVTLADPRFRRALARWPGHFVAGACLPDVSLVSGIVRAQPLQATHQWRAAAAVLRRANNGAECAIAAGYAVHLLTDIVAHNYFVPAHERLWFRLGMISHAACEWAMDAHLARHIRASPSALMAQHHGALCAFACRHLAVDRAQAARALNGLARAEGLLRATRVPNMVLAAARRADGALGMRFDAYVRATVERLHLLDRLIAGDTPAWLPEPEAPPPPPPRAPDHGPYVLLLPADFFRAEESR